MTKPRLLDLFSGAGGAGMGYARAGFDVVGVDIKPQPHYPFEFVQADALTFPLDGFDVIHASPPCQAYSRLNTRWKRDYPMLIEPVRDWLVASGLPYVIENVPDAPLLNGMVLCGSMFGLRIVHAARVFFLQRHRRFESNRSLWGAGGCAHRIGQQAGGVYGNGEWSNNGSEHRGGWQLNKASAAELMGIDWMNRDELAEAIPPAYTEFIGRQLIEQLERVA